VTASEALADERVRELAHTILTRREYARFRPLDPELVGRFTRWLADAIRWLADLYEVSPLLWYALFFSLLLVSAALLAHVVWTVRVALRAPAPATPRAEREERPRFDREAERLAAAGRLLEAAHAMHLACIERLLRSGALELRRHEANRTLRRRLAAAALAPAQRGEFLRLLDALEARWFRDPTPRAPDAELFEGWRALHRRLGETEARA
jgi:hypothetical protein